MKQSIRRLQVLRSKQEGMTVIELLAVILVIGVLLALVFAAYTGVQRNNRNQERQADIQAIYQQLEAYYVNNSNYPTLAEINSASWRAIDMKTLNKEALRDPSSTSYLLVAQPTKNVYSYEVTAADGGSCDDTARVCAHYTLTATLETTPPSTYVKSSLN